MSQSHRHDVIVIGGGPAGSTVAALAAQAGRDVLLLDRETFPRFRIGESLMPATYWTFQRLGLLEKMNASSFVRKHSVQFVAKSGRSSAPFYFSEFDPHESSVTWQVERAAFDQMLLEHARDSGAQVRQQANVKDILFEGDRAVGVDVELAGDRRERIHAPVTVDASGQTAMIARKLALRRVDPQLRHASIFTRYRGARREPGIDAGATLVLQTERPRFWFWYIPLQNDEMSVGVVGPIDELLGARGGAPGAIFEEEAARCPALGERIRGARRSADYSVLRDFSYVSKRIAGDGWVLAGDAFGFLDPIYSTGVFLAFKSAEFAADAIEDAFRTSDFSAAVLGRHGQRYLDGMEAMRKLVYAYYDESFHVAAFVKEHPHCREHIVNLLVGNVFRRPIDGLFEAMGRIADLPESRKLEPS